jgi:multidrug efflux system outer membrane protein
MMIETKDVQKKTLARKSQSKWPSFCLVVCIAMLTGCQSDVERKSAASDLLPNTYNDNPSTERNRSVGAWQDFVADPTLKKLIAQAISQNRDLRLASLRVAEARAAYGIQKTEKLPTLSAQAELIRAGVPGDINGTNQRITANQFTLGVGFNRWEIDFWGRVQNLNEAALESYWASQATQKASTLSLIAQVSQGYLLLVESDERLALAKRAVISRQESLRIMRRRFEEGATSKLDLAQAEMLSQQAQILVTQLEQNRALQIHALTLLLGNKDAITLETQNWDNHPPLGEIKTGVPADLLIHRPDIQAAEHSLAAAHANIGAARAAFFPRIALTSNVGTASTELDGLLKGGSLAWNFSPTISLPIFDGGRLRASLDFAEIRRDAAIAYYEQTIQAAFRDVADALTAQYWLKLQIKNLDATIAVQTERTRLANLRYESGAARYLEVLDAERELLTIKQERIQVQRAFWASQIALYIALGGDDSINPSSFSL